MTAPAAEPAAVPPIPPLEPVFAPHAATMRGALAVISGLAMDPKGVEEWALGQIRALAVRALDAEEVRQAERDRAVLALFERAPEADRAA